MDSGFNPRMKNRKWSRRHLFRAAFYGLPAIAVVNAIAIEPSWIKVRTIRLGAGAPKHRLVHFTDLHFKGDADYLGEVVDRVNQLSPDFVCFTGDIIEEVEHLEAALKILSGVKAPLYGIPGNHDHWSHADFEPIAETFAATGGAWLEDRQLAIRNGAVSLTGIDRLPMRLDPVPGRINILLAHYPEWADKLEGRKFDLILAGHTHGGQVRIPFYGPLMVPFSTGEYDLGMFDTPAGPLYVNPGVGCFYLNVRFNCRPELTVFEMA
jgi:uncharacterized protein